MMRNLEFVTAGGMATLLPPSMRSAPYRLSIDDGSGMIRGTLEGSWTPAQAEDFVADLIEMIDDCRRRRGTVRILVDRRAMPPQSPPVAERLATADAVLFEVDDRLAVVVGSSLAKGQMRLRFRRPGSQAFLSHAAAELWLSAWR